MDSISKDSIFLLERCKDQDNMEGFCKWFVKAKFCNQFLAAAIEHCRKSCKKCNVAKLV